MNYSKIWLHGIFCTAGKLPLINHENETYITSLLRECFSNQGSEIHCISALKDHVHVLFVCNPETAFFKVLENVYEESAVLINEKFFKANSFSWEKAHILFSVSESQIPKVKEYIEQQKEFHKTKNLTKEIDDFLSLHGLK